jgi:hypothetical protein
MPRFLTVNGFSGSSPVPRGSQDLNFDPDASAERGFGVETGLAGSESAPYAVTSTIRKNSGDQGPCLYFGPQGQRCNRPALANGFCANHTPAQLGQPSQPGIPAPVSELFTGAPSPAAKPFARLIAVGAIFAALWPEIADLLREIIRWIHAH